MLQNIVSRCNTINRNVRFTTAITCTYANRNSSNNKQYNNNFSISNVRYAHSVGTLNRHGRGGRVSISGNTATVFGATGFLGRYIVNELGKIGTQIIIAHRPGEMHFRHLRPMADVGEMTFVETDFSNYDQIKEVVQYSDIVINCIGADVPTRNFSLNNANGDIPARIAKACNETKVERLVHISALGANPNSASNFFKSKAYGEQLVLNNFKNATILRPSQMFGVEDNFINRICFALNWKVLPVCHLDTDRLPVYVGDVASAAVNAATFDEKSPGQTYELVGPKKYSIDNLLGMAVKFTYNSPHVFEVPTSLGKLIINIHNKVLVLKERKMDEDQFVRYGISESENLTSKPGLSDLGVEARCLDSEFIRLYRRHRNALHTDEFLGKEV